MNNVQQKVAAFFEAYPLRKIDKSQTLIHAGEPLEHVFYLAKGRVNQYDISPRGTEVVVNIFKPGSFFPMSSAINGTAPEYFFGAATNAEVYAAPAKDVVQFLHDNPDVLFDLLSRVYRGADGLLKRMTHMMAGDAKSRLIFEIINSAYRFGEPQPDGSVIVALNEGDLARQSGLARETVSRTMQSLKTTELITVNGGGLVIKNIESLQALLTAGTP